MKTPYTTFVNTRPLISINYLGNDDDLKSDDFFFSKCDNL